MTCGYVLDNSVLLLVAFAFEMKSLWRNHFGGDRGEIHVSVMKLSVKQFLKVLTESVGLPFND